MLVVLTALFNDYECILASVTDFLKFVLLYVNVLVVFTTGLMNFDAFFSWPNAKGMIREGPYPSSKRVSSQ